MTNSWEAYFIFSEKERKGIIVLGVILTLSVVFTWVLPRKENSMEKASTVSTKGLHLFKFDPNTIDSADALILGIPLKQVKTLMHYREKGGRFYKKEDLLKLYGLDIMIAKKLIPYIEFLPSTNAFNRKKPLDRGLSHAYTPWSSKKNRATDWQIDINQADQSEWYQKTKLPPHIVHQILNYKNHIGGFTQILQLKKVYGLAESDFQLLRPHLIVQKNFKPILNANHMNFDQWRLLGIFDEQQIYEIMKLRKAQGGKINWRQLVILLELPEKQALWLKTQIFISD